MDVEAVDLAALSPTRGLSALVVEEILLGHGPRPQ